MRRGECVAVWTRPTSFDLCHAQDRRSLFSRHLWEAKEVRWEWEWSQMSLGAPRERGERSKSQLCQLCLLISLTLSFHSHLRNRSKVPLYRAAFFQPFCHLGPHQY